MLAEHCGSRRSLQKRNSRRQTYSSLSRYPKSQIKQTEQQSGSSASVDTQKLTQQIHKQPQGSINSRQQSNVRTLEEFEVNNDKTKTSHYSESILVTSLAKGLNEGCNNNGGVSHAVNKCTTNDRKILRPVTIGIIKYFH